MFKMYYIYINKTFKRVGCQEKCMKKENGKKEICIKVKDYKFDKEYFILN